MSKIFLRHTLTKKIRDIFDSLSLYIFTIWKCIAYNFFCRDGIYFDKILFKNAIYKTRYKYFRSSIIYVQNWRVCELLKCISRNTNTTNEPTTRNTKSERPQVNIWDIWKTLKYLNINDSFHLKDLEISKYKRESKRRWPMKISRFIFVNCCLIRLSKH
jgi:hypothetical protein